MTRAWKGSGSVAYPPVDKGIGGDKHDLVKNREKHLADLERENPDILWIGTPCEARTVSWTTGRVTKRANRKFTS